MVNKILLCLTETYLIQHQAMKACEEVDVQPHIFLTLALNGGVWLQLHISAPQYPANRAVRPQVTVDSLQM